MSRFVIKHFPLYRNNTGKLPYAGTKLPTIHTPTLSAWPSASESTVYQHGDAPIARTILPGVAVSAICAIIWKLPPQQALSVSKMFWDLPELTENRLFLVYVT